MAIWNERIKNLRRNILRMEVEEFAEAVSIPSARILEIEGTGKVYADELVKIANTYHITADYLVGETDIIHMSNFDISDM